MKKSAFVLASFVWLASQLLTSVRAVEEKIEPASLPKPVAAALNARFPGAEIKSAAKETEDNQVVYDIELTLKGRKFESDVKEDGTILEVEKEIAKKDWPKAPIAAVQAKYPKASVQEVMEVSKVSGKEEKPDHLEITIETADKKSKEVLSSLDGKTITEEPATPVAEASDKIETSALPEPVKATIKTKFPDAEIVSAEKGDEDGKVVFEVSIKNKNQNMDVSLTPEGKILVIEKAITESALPKAVSKALAERYPKAKTTLVEEVWKDEKLSGYEVTVQTADQKSHAVEFDTNGKFVGEE
jgi:hypothetical protein